MAVESHRIKYYEEDEEDDSGCCCNCLKFTFCQFPWAACLFTFLSLLSGALIHKNLGKIQVALKGLSAVTTDNSDFIAPIRNVTIIALITVLAVNGVLVFFGVLTSKAVTDCACTEQDCCSSFVRCFTTTVSFFLYIFCCLINVGTVCLMAACFMFLLPAYMLEGSAEQYMDAGGALRDNLVKMVTEILNVMVKLQEKYGWVKRFTPTIDPSATRTDESVGNMIDTFAGVCKGMGNTYATICFFAVLFVIAQIAMTIVARDNYVLAREVDAKPDKKLVAEETIEVNVTSGDYVQKLLN